MDGATHQSRVSGTQITYLLLNGSPTSGPIHNTSASSEQEYFYSRITKQDETVYEPAADSVLVLKV